MPFYQHFSHIRDQVIQRLSDEILGGRTKIPCRLIVHKQDAAVSINRVYGVVGVIHQHPVFLFTRDQGLCSLPAPADIMDKNILVFLAFKIQVTADNFYGKNISILGTAMGFTCE